MHTDTLVRLWISALSGDQKPTERSSRLYTKEAASLSYAYESMRAKKLVWTRTFEFPNTKTGAVKEPGLEVNTEQTKRV